MQNKTLFRDLIPYRAGIVRVTPLDSNFNPIYDKSYTTDRDFLTSTQRSTSYSYETFYNSNGDPTDYISQRRENLTLTTQIRDPRFEALISGKELAIQPIPFLVDLSFYVDPHSSYYQFQNPSSYPNESNDKHIHIEIRDVFGNRYVESSSPRSENEFKYDQAQHRIEFFPTDSTRLLHCSYYTVGSEQESYEHESIIKNNVFMVEAYGEVQSASSGEKQACYTCIKSCTLSGELSGLALQKSINNSISYTFASYPFKRGESPCTEIFGKL